MSHRHGFNRRDFLKLSGLGLGGATLAACERRTNVIEVTATKAPPPANKPALPANTAAPPARHAGSRRNCRYRPGQRQYRHDGCKAHHGQGAGHQGWPDCAGRRRGGRARCDRRDHADHRPARAHRDPRTDRRALPLERLRSARHGLRRHQLAGGQHHRRRCRPRSRNGSPRRRRRMGGGQRDG